MSRGGGIRTPGTREGSPVFKTGAINRSTTPLCTVILLKDCKNSALNQTAKHRPTANMRCCASQYVARLDRKSSDGPGSEGGFVSKISGLSADSTYHATAYAKNSYGVVYGNSVTFRTFNAAPVTDLSGNVYHPLIIGTQVWMNENLKTTKYKDGTDISGYSWYNNDENQYKNPYGALYSWETISSDKLCPVGWHVPSSDEFDKLIAYGDPLHQNKDIDKTEFSSVFGGLWSDPGGFSSLDHYGFYGSSSETFFVRTLTRTVVNISMR